MGQAETVPPCIMLSWDLSRWESHSCACYGTKQILWVGRCLSACFTWDAAGGAWAMMTVCGR